MVSKKVEELRKLVVVPTVLTPISEGPNRHERRKKDKLQRKKNKQKPQDETSNN